MKTELIENDVEISNESTLNLSLNLQKKNYDIELSAIPFKEINNSTFYNLVKRAFDIFVAILSLIVISPLVLIISVLIKLEDNGQVFFRHERIGKKGRIIKIYKFRSMRNTSEDFINLLSKEQYEEYKREFKVTNDPRVTRVGRILRKTSLDELPQLINILKGEMSIVGPRPIVKSEFENYSQNQTAELLSVRPGLTGYWQAYARNKATYSTGIRQSMELHYVKNASIGMDIKIIFKTFAMVVKCMKNNN